MSNKGRVWTILSMIKWAEDFFHKKNVPDPRLSIEWILAEALEIKRLDLYMQFDRPLSTEELDKIRPLVKRRADYEPLQYITGTADFLDAKIHVNPCVLIPRIETEQLVDLLLEKTKDIADKPVRLLDIGTGSGCIPIAIKLKRPNWICSGLDISGQALELASKNAGLNQTDVDFFTGDINRLTEIESEPWHIIISNPPYITEPEKEDMHEQVLKHEPKLALFHENPLDLYKKIIEFAAAQNARLFLECNDKTAGLAAEIAGTFFNHSELLKDLDGNNRFIFADKPVTSVIP
jgi:release factor glutamine methyltransferase